MLGGISGADFAFRVGLVDGLYFLMRVVVPWTLIDTDFFSLALGMGGEMTRTVGTTYMAPLISVRTAGDLGLFRLRVEYDWNVDYGHRFRAHVPLFGGLGKSGLVLGAELAFYDEHGHGFHQRSVIIGNSF
ncbi:MAG: hypothetical protein H0U74_16390 [Bradymonadaceae bacterium]|nr:hypothetical protein [Lujinxingiaceae bacterium]